MARDRHPEKERGDMAITKRELARKIALNHGLRQDMVRQVIQSFLDEVIAEMAQGNRLEFREFGIFDVHTKKARLARNPKTGVTIQIPEKRVPHFKPGRLMKERVLDNKPQPV